jgi:hypothetical protein
MQAIVGSVMAIALSASAPKASTVQTGFELTLGEATCVSRVVDDVRQWNIHDEELLGQIWMQIERTAGGVTITTDQKIPAMKPYKGVGVPPRPPNPIYGAWRVYHCDAKGNVVRREYSK